MTTAAMGRRLGGALLALSVLLTAAVGVSAAAAAPAAAEPTCQRALERPFLRWLDPAWYTLAPGGDFEAATTWSLSGGAKVVSGNEPFYVRNTRDHRSLSIPAGGSATSPAMCIGLDHPTLRLFGVGGNLLSSLRVEVIYRTALGTVTQPVGLVPAQSSWSPTSPMLVLANVTGLLSLDGLTSSVRFRFTALGTAAWKIDDVYVDPWKVT